MPRRRRIEQQQAIAVNQLKLRLRVEPVNVRHVVGLNFFPCCEERGDLACRAFFGDVSNARRRGQNGNALRQITPDRRLRPVFRDPVIDGQKLGAGKGADRDLGVKARDANPTRDT